MPCHAGAALQKLGDLLGALACYDGALKLKPGDANIYVNRGICLAAAARQADAVEAYDIALAIQPQHANALCVTLGCTVPACVGYWLNIFT